MQAEVQAYMRASVTVIAILDPLYKSKIADIRDIISIIRNNGQ